MQYFKSNSHRFGQVQVSIEIENQGKNVLLARCPELGLIVRSDEKEKALKRLESIIIYCLTVADDFGISRGLVKHIETHGHINIKQFINVTSH
jgi:hypothetical protein